MGRGNGVFGPSPRSSELDAAVDEINRRLRPTQEADWERVARRNAARRAELEVLRDLVVAVETGELLDELLERAHELLAAAAADGYHEARLPGDIPHDEEQ